ncbi:MAG: hypothetical protein KKH72_06300 [Alphaproteobacteria bacterium]|nr:hypothetical protein [Alphaproteobacteria bacterium]
MKTLRALWNGEMPLADAFWIWAVAIGLAVNFLTSALFVVLAVNGRFIEALVAGYAFSVPYNLVACVGVWRAAARHEGSALHAYLARVASLALVTLLSVT